MPSSTTPPLSLPEAPEVESPVWIRVRDVHRVLERRTGIRWHPSKVQRLVSQGRIPSYRILDDRVVAEQDLEALSRPVRCSTPSANKDFAVDARRRRAIAATARMESAIQSPRNRPISRT